MVCLKIGVSIVQIHDDIIIINNSTHVYNYYSTVNVNLEGVLFCAYRVT